MAASPAAIANRALAHLGQAGTIVNLATDTTTAGKACRQFYDDARLQTLKAHRWQSATQQAALTLVEEIPFSQTREWLYKYRLPEDCLTPHRILWNGIRNPRPDQVVPFRTMADTVSTAYNALVTYPTGSYASVTADGVTTWYRALRETIGDNPPAHHDDWRAITGGPPMFLYTDEKNAVLEYVYDANDPTRYARDLADAIAVLLAYYIAPLVTVNGSAVTLQERAVATWQLLTGQAMANDFMAQQRDMPPESTYVGARFWRGWGGR